MAAGIVMNAGRFYWNVDAHVGLGSANKTEDVHLVQLAFACKAVNPKFPPGLEEKKVYEAVVVGVPCTGSPDDPLCKAIKMEQTKRPGVKDGYVSKMQASGTYGSDMAWMMARLNNNIADVLGGDWPFLDRHPKSTAALKALVTRTFVIGG